MLKHAALFIIILNLFPVESLMASQELRTVKTYMSFVYPVDPANVKTLVDLDICYALSTTLVDWDESRNLTAGLATVIESKRENELLLKLKPTAKWSDGTPVTAKQVLRSIDHAKLLHDEAMKGLFEMVTDIEAKDEHTVLFRLNRPVAQSQILFKLTEPVYGVVFIKEDGTQDLSKTTGPFTLEASSKEELTFDQNTNWYLHQPGMPEKIIIRQPKPGTQNTDDGFAGDPWPNLMASSSLMSASSAANLKKEHYSIWNRNLDRTFFFSPGPRLRNAEGRALFQFLNQKLDRNQLLKGLSGYHLAQQYFPSGFPLYDPDFEANTSATHLPEKFKSEPLQIVAPEGRVSGALQENIIRSIEAMTGVKPVLKIVPLNTVMAAIAEAKHDIAILTVAVNDPNEEGPVSFVFGVNPSFIANSDGSKGDFKARIIKARAMDQKSRNVEYRRVFTQATNEGCVLPLFHFSSTAIARDGLDLSKIPTTDETVSFAKVRFK